jgi:exopolyphosphatase/guanosine-5'-triphosphate,3'-diphosphate pyrophosphatase
MTSSSPVAAIDLGTNTCLLLVARREGSTVVPLAQELRVVRLGEGLEATGHLSDDAMNRAVTALREYHKIITDLGCKNVWCVATAAFRTAANAKDLQQRIRQATGFEISSINGQREAELVSRAVREVFPPTAGTRITVDVGGGSTEIIVEQAGALADIVSLPIGSVQLTERHLTSDPPEVGELARLRADIAQILGVIAITENLESFIGVGGTATTFVAMKLGLAVYDHDRVHGATLTIDSLDAILQHCAALPLVERKQLPGLHPGRAEVIVAGGLILSEVMERLGVKVMQVSDHGLRWGMVLELLAETTGGTGP